jgi:integrase
MADINDARHVRGELANQYELLEAARIDPESEEAAAYRADHAPLHEKRKEKLTADPISQAEYEAIKSFAGYSKRHNGSIGTVKTYLSRLTTSTVRAEKPLIDFQSTADIEALLDTHEAAGTQSASALNNHLSALRQFWKWLEGTPAYGHDEYRFRKLVENVEPSDDNPGPKPVDPEFVPSESEVETLRLSATVFPSRDGALVEFLADAGPRISLACQMRCGDVSVPHNARGTFRPNPDGLSHKKVPDRRYRLHESQAVLRRWLTDGHPEAPEPPADAPLFPVKRGYDSDHPEEAALSPSGAEYALKQAAENAGIDPDRVHPHNFRKTAITRMRAKHEMDWEAIQLRIGASEQSITDLRTAYERLDADEKLEIVDSQLGGGAERETDEPAPEAAPIPCVGCSHEIEPGWTFCNHCGAKQALESDTHAQLTKAAQEYGLKVMEASLEKAQSDLGVDRDAAAEHLLEGFFADD